MRVTVSAADSFREYLGQLEPKNHGIIALDDMTHQESALLLNEVGQYFGMAKENANAQSQGWLDSVQRNRELGFDLMADAKYHDTPRTMKSHVKSTVLNGAKFITIHTSSDIPALEAAARGRDEARAFLSDMYRNEYDPFVGSLLGITILTSLNDVRCEAIYGMPRKEKVLQLGGFAVEAGLEGIVCAVSDLWFLQQDPDIAKLIKVTPGIVLPGEDKPSGQEETATPEEAISEGADFVVMGTAVTKALSRQKAAELTVQGIAKGLGK